MAEIRVNVSANKSKSVSVSSANVGTEISASADLGLYWSQKAKNWAISNNIVDNEDYSAKYYANKSKSSANESQSYANNARETYTNFVSDANNYIAEVVETKDSAIAEVESKTSNVVEGIEAKGQETVSAIETTKNNSISAVRTEGQTQIKNIKSTGFYMENDKLYFTNSKGEKVEFKSGGGGLEIGDIGFTQMAIDETKGKRRVLNGQLIIQDQYVQFTNKIKNSVALNPDLACTELEWQTAVTMSAYGLCEKFVIDDEAGTIRLPKYPDYFIAGLDGIAPVVGNATAIGFKQIKDGTTMYGSMCTNSGQAMFYAGCYGQPVGTWRNGSHFDGGTGIGLTTDASKSGVEAQLSNNQTEQIKGTYFIQVATGAETEDNIINEIELNNPFSLLDYKYSEYELNNLSWLRSNGQYNSKAVYPAVYELLLKIYNGAETKAGVSVKLSTEAYTDYDFVLNTADETFRLPIKVKLASGKAVVGNGMAVGVTNGSQNAGLNGSQSNSAWDVFNPNCYGLDVSSSGPSAGHIAGNIGITTDPNYSGIETSDSDLYLYFYVGETVQNANLINAGRIEEKIVGKLDRSDVKAYITETYVNGASWYRIWSDGWIEQGGYVSSIATGGTITFLKPFKDTNYIPLVVKQSTSNTGNNGTRPVVSCNASSKNSMTVYNIWTSNDATFSISVYWEAKGF